MMKRERNPKCNLVPRAHVPFGQHQDTELWNNQFPETKILGLPASQRMRGLVYMASRDKVDVDTFHKGIQYALERLRKSKFGLESTTVSNFKSKSHEGSGNELVDYSRAPCLGADQKARGLWERDCPKCLNHAHAQSFDHYEISSLTDNVRALEPRLTTQPPGVEVYDWLYL